MEGKHILWIVIIWVCIMVVSEVSPRELHYTRSSIPLPRRDSSVEFEDLNGDSLKDLVVADSKRSVLTIYWQENSLFKEKNCVNIKLSRDTLGYEFIDIASFGGKEIILIKPESVSYIAFSDQHSSPGYYEKTLFSIHVLDVSEDMVFEPFILRRYNLAFDMNADGREDLLIPAFDGLMVLYNLGPGKFNLQKVRSPAVRKNTGAFWHKSYTLSGAPLYNEINLRYYSLLNTRKSLSAVAGDIYEFTYSRYTPQQRYFLFDENQDGKMDVISSSTLFLQLPDGSFKEYGRKKIKERTEAEMEIFSGVINRSEWWRKFTTTKDIDGDGSEEYLFSDTTVSVFTPKTEIWIYRLEDVKNQKNPKPRWRFVLKGLPPEYGILPGLHSIPLIDLDEDGDLDLLLMRLNFQGASVRSHLKSFIRKGIEGEIEAYLWEKDKGFATKPAFSVPIRIDYNAYLAQGNTLIKVIYDRDFDGDGKADLCVTEGKNIIKIFRFLSAKKGYEQKPAGYMMTRYPIVSVTPVQINNDAKEDLVVWTRDPDQNKDFLSIFISED